MFDEATIRGMKRKRGELAREIIELDKERNQAIAKMEALDNVLHAFGCVEDLEAIPIAPRPQTRLFQRGQLQRLIHDIRREHPDLKDNRGIAVAIGAKMGWPDDNAFIRNVAIRVKHARRDARIREEAIISLDE
jgi:hypothetical protein